MNRGEWWQPSFGGHLMFISGRNMTLSVKELSSARLQELQQMIADCSEFEDMLPNWVYNKYVCTVSLGSVDINLDKCGQTLEEAKRLCVEFAVALCKQMLYELGEDINITHVVVEAE